MLHHGCVMFEGGRALIHRAGIIRGAVFIGGFRERELFLRLREVPPRFSRDDLRDGWGELCWGDVHQGFLVDHAVARKRAGELAVLLTARDVLGDREIVHLDAQSRVGADTRIVRASASARYPSTAWLPTITSSSSQAMRPSPESGAEDLLAAYTRCSSFHRRSTRERGGLSQQGGDRQIVDSPYFS